jgi:hypothetical protein
LEQYEQLPENASGAGSSLEKQEGNVHGYEQEEVEEKGETIGEAYIVDGDSKSKKDEIEEIVVEVIDYERGKELSGDTQKVDIEIHMYDAKESMINKNIECNLTLIAWLNNRKSYIFDVEGVKGILKKKLNYSIEITESFIAIGDGVKIDLKINKEYPVFIK